MIYHPQTPVDIIFNQVEDLVEFSEMANCPFSNSQMINIAYTIINKTKCFRDGIIAWNQKPALDKMWINFMTHFRIVHDELAETGELTKESCGYHQANLVEDIVGQMTDLYPLQNHSPEPPPPVIVQQPVIQKAPEIQQIQNANAAVNTTVQQQLLAQMQQMQTMMLTLQNKQEQGGNGAHTPHVCPPWTGLHTGQPTAPLPAWATKYCWTHGKCAHNSTACNNKAPGHRNNAAMETKQNGCAWQVRPILINEGTENKIKILENKIIFSWIQNWIVS